jgi:hypothetical protein
MVTKPATRHKVDLTSAEIANIWTNYLNDTMAVCTIGFFLAHVEDEETRNVLEYAYQLSQVHIQKLKLFFEEEQFPIPMGFSWETDVNVEAPRLFTDDFYLFYIQNIGKIGLASYAMSLANSARLDICEYYTECISESSRLLNKATELMLMNGTFIRAPFIPKPQIVEFIQKQSYLSNWFGETRPLNVIEMSNIFFNLIQNQLGRTLLMGFSQVTRSQEVRNYLIRGRDIANKHTKIFESILSAEFLPSASTWNVLPTDSTTTTYSDKLLMFHTITLNTAGIGNYGISLGQSSRSDLGINYVRLMAEISSYTEDGANLMIEKGWMEKPPQATDRDQLSNDMT